MNTRRMSPMWLSLLLSLPAGAIAQDAPICFTPDGDPVTLADMTTYGEAFAEDGAWPLDLSADTFVNSEAPLVRWRWILDTFTEDFEDGAAGWEAIEGDWSFDDANPLDGSRSFRQTNVNADRTRNLYSEVFDGDLEVEFTYRMTAGTGQEVQLLLAANDWWQNYEIIIRGRNLNDVLVYQRLRNSTSGLIEVDLAADNPIRPISLDVDYHVKVTHIGNLISVYLEGQLIAQVSNGTFKKGRVGFSTYRTAALFDNLVVRTVSDAATAEHTYDEGVHFLTLEVEDSVGLSNRGIVPIRTVRGAPPVAAVVGPLTIDEFTGNAVRGGFTTTLDGTGSSDPEGSALRYVWDLGTDAFNAATVRDGEWNTAGNITQGGAIRATAAGSWNQTYAFTHEAFPRGKGQLFEATVTSTGNMMTGWKANNTTGQYTQYPYAIYFNSGNLYIYEKGSQIAYVGGYSTNTAYDVQIELKPDAGAIYRLRAAGGGAWRQLWESDQYTDSPLRKGFDVSSGVATLDNLRRIAIGPQPSVKVFGLGQIPVTLTVTDPAGSTSQASTTLTTVPNDPPVADIGPALFLDETTAWRGQWAVNLSAAASTDDHGIDFIEWDFSYDAAAGFQPSGERGVNVSHVFPGPAVHTVAARVTDHAGQTSLATKTITLSLGAPPVANAGGPYVFDEFTGDAFGGGFMVTLDGSASADAESPTLRYAWRGPADVFGGTRVNEGRWHNAGATQNDGLSVTSTNNNWTTRYLVTRDSVPRADGTALEARVTPVNGRHMIGFKRINNDFNYTQFPYAIYFENGTMRVYEGGSKRLDGPTYNQGQDYDVRIELKAGGGAFYWFKRAADADYTLLYDSAYDNSAALLRGSTTYDGTITYRSFTDVVGGRTPTWRMFGIGEQQVELTVTDQGEQSHATNVSVTLLGNDPPVSAAGADQALGELLAREAEFPVSLDGTASTDDHGIFRYDWDLNYDGLNFDVDVQDESPDLTLLGPGARTIALRVTDHALQTHLDTLTVVLGTGQAPVADAGDDITTEGKWPVLFDGRRSTDDVEISHYDWSFGDGKTGRGAQPQHIFWALGEYTVALMVRDRAGNFDDDTMTVRSIVADPPVANAGGPYGGSAGGRPAYFDGRSSTDDYGIVNYWWDVNAAVDSDGDGNPRNDRDLQGPRPMFAYAAPGTYTAVLTVVDGADQTSTDEATVIIDDTHGPNVIAVPWRGNDPLARHEIINGRPTRLKGIARAAGALTYQWDFGDGSPPTAVAAVTNNRIIESTHTYPDVPVNTPFTATLRVWDAQGRMGEDQYYLIMKPDDIDTRTNVSIDEGLWYMHRIQQSDGSWRYSSYWASPTASALQAYLINSHRLEGDNTEDPFVETVNRGMKLLVTRLRRRNMSVQAYGDPDSNANGYGVEVAEGNYVYQGGMVLDALAATGQPLWVAEGGVAEVKGRYLHEIVTDMVDAYAWGQNDSGNGRGGWYYSWNSGTGDNSVSQWAAIGMQAAEDSFGIIAPDFVREQNLVWMNYSTNGTGFGYTGPGNTQNMTPSGMVQVAFSGVRRWEPLFANAEAEITRRFLWQYNDYYGLFALTKALRLARPEPIDTLAGGIDWYSDPVRSVRQRLTDDMLRDNSGATWGSWNKGSWGDRTLHSAWAIIMLTPTLFVQPPVADAGDDIVWAYGVPLSFDASRSFHTDPIRSLVKYEWDFDGDGTYDYVTNDPRDPNAVFTYADPNPDTEGDAPQIIDVRLRVTDNNLPPQTDVDVRRITVAEPPHAPFARAGGPYFVTAGVPVILDGSASFDLDPGDSISVYEWDLDDDGRFFDDVDISTDQARVQYVFPAPGLYDIALRVRDRGVFNPVGCVLGVDCVPLESAPDFTRVTVIANVAPVADAGGPYEIDEGQVLQLVGSGTFDANGDALTYEWDLDGDGTADLTGETPDYDATDDAFLDVDLTVSDGALQSTASTTIFVRNVAPFVDAGGDVVQPNGLRITNTGAFADPGADVWDATVDYGDGSGPQPLALLADKTFILDHTYPQAGQYPVIVIVHDDDGGEGISQVLWEVTNTQPIVQLGDDETVDEGSAFQRLGRFVDPDDNAWTATVDYGDGAGPQPLALNPDKTFTLDHTYPDDGVHPVIVRVDDHAGGVGGAQIVVTVRNVAPSPQAGDDVTIDEGQAFTFSGDFTDPGADTWSATVDYDDGAGPVALALDGKNFELNHTYADDGVHTVTVTVTDDDNGVGTDVVVVTVRNVAPEVDAGEDTAIVEGGDLARDGTFTDPGADTWTATVDYGDGSDEEALDLTDEKGFSLAHTYADDGVYTVTVTVTDDDGGEGEATFEVTVGNANPVVLAGDDEIIDEGGGIARAGTFADPGADTWSATVDYGDGSGVQPLALTPEGGFALAHTYADDGDYPVVVTVTDDDGGIGQAGFTVHVNNVAPSVAAGEDEAIDEGSGIARDGAFSDPGADTWTATVDYGDGSGPQVLALTADKGFALAHTYRDDGAYIVTVTVTDDDNGVGVASFTVTVRNVAPTVEVADQRAECAESLAVTASFTDPGPDDTHDASFAWGDGEPDSIGQVDLVDRLALASHVYSAVGDYPLVVTVTDDDDGVGHAEGTVTVVDTTRPTLTCPVDVEIEADAVCLGHVDLVALVADTCDPNVAIVDDARADYALGENTVSYSATDASGNASECATQVTVVDRIPPVANAGPDQLDVEATAACDVAVLLDGTASADNCGIVSWAWTEGDVALGDTAELVPTLTGVGDHVIGLAVCDAAGACASDEVVVRLERALMSCGAISQVNLKLPGAQDDGSRDDGSHDDGSHDHGSRDDDDDSGRDDNSNDDEGNHLFVDGVFGLNDCSSKDLAALAGYVKVDDQRYEIPAGGLRPVGNSGKFKYTAPRVGHFRWELTVDARKGTWSLKANHQTRTGLSPDDGLAIEIRLGDQVARQTVPVEGKGKRMKEWLFKDKAATCAADDDSHDHGSRDDGSRDDGSRDDGSRDDGSRDDGSRDDGSRDDGSRDDGSADHGSSDKKKK